MMGRGLALALVGAALAGCVAIAPGGDFVAGPSVVAALDTQADGYRGVTDSGEPFTIVSTSASATELCRVVTVDRAGRFEVESFCKIRGGQWR